MSSNWAFAHWILNWNTHIRKETFTLSLSKDRIKHLLYYLYYLSIFWIYLPSSSSFTFNYFFLKRFLYLTNHVFLYYIFLHDKLRVRSADVPFLFLHFSFLFFFFFCMCFCVYSLKSFRKCQCVMCIVYYIFEEHHI